MGLEGSNQSIVLGSKFANDGSMNRTKSINIDIINRIESEVDKSIFAEKTAETWGTLTVEEYCRRALKY